MERGFSFTNEVYGFTAAGLALCVSLVIIVRSLRRKRKTPEELEAIRRGWLSVHGKLGGGEIVEVQDNEISYMYDVRGMTYNTSQDVSALGEHLPADRWSIVGAVGVKYDPRNPANSIVVSEGWTGLRQQKGAACLPRDKRP